MLTHVFKLPSGVECEVKELTGKHQRLMTEQKSGSKKNKTDGLNEMLADVLVRVGNNTGPFDKDFVKAMLTADRKTIMVEVRNFTLGSEAEEDNIFTFTYEYIDHDGKKASIEREVDLEDGKFPTKPYAQQWENYNEIKKEVQYTLPRSQKVCVWKMMDGFSEEIAGSIKKEDMSSHTPLIVRNVRLLEPNKAGDGFTPITQQSSDLDKWGYKDIEALRKHIKDTEGRVDTEEMFEHPEAEFKGPGEKNVVVDIVSLKAFFFPSQAI